MTTQVVFAANANALDGSGHLKRCIEYANCLDKSIYTPTIYGDCEIQWLSDFASKKDIKISKSCDFNRKSILIIDSYNEVFINELLHRFRYVKPIQIADPYTPLNPDTNIIWFDPGPIPLEIADRVIASGTNYFPVWNFSSTINRFPVAENVLISVGGSRQAKVLGRLIDAIDSNFYKTTTFHVLGENEFDSTFRNKFVFYSLGDSLGSLIRVCDTAITASGVSSWDFLSNKLCMGFFKFVANQSSNYSFLKDHKLGIPLSADGVIFDYDSVQLLITDSQWRCRPMPMVSELFDFKWQSRFGELMNSIARNF